MSVRSVFGFSQFVLCLVLINVASCQTNKITNLPGYKGSLNFEQYGGYITVNTTYQRGMYYWFVESQDSPSTDPIVLWLQGGPGCSGVWALFEEHGPYRIEIGGDVVSNPWSWNRHANVIYVDSPCGVGFSYSNTSQGLQTNDNQTAQDTYAFLQGWFNEFPAFKTNDFYITGESYGGVYVPTLTNQILDGPDAHLKSSLKGLMVGNPVINCPQIVPYGPTIQIDLFYYHGLVSFADRHSWYQAGCDKNPKQSVCDSLYATLESSIGPYSGDDLYANFCTGNGTLDVLDEVQDCYTIGQRTELYLNRKDVQTAIHAKSKYWLSCTAGYITGLNYTKLDMNMLDYYNKFFDVAPQLRIMIFSGDVDISTVPHAFTQFCLSHLNATIVTPWTRWVVPGPKIQNFIPDHKEKSNVTAGYVQVYDNYIYATVKGAGHEVPLYQPYLGYYLFDRFVVNKQVP